MISELIEIIKKDLNKTKSLDKNLTKVKSLIKKNQHAEALKLFDVINMEISFLHPETTDLINSYMEEIKSEYRKFKLNFDREIIYRCEEKNLVPIIGDSLKGFQVKGLININIDFDKSTSIISTSSKFTKIKSLKSDDIISNVLRLHKRLFERNVDPVNFLEELSKAYRKITKDRNDIEVPLRDVQREVWIARQKDSFWLTFDNDKLLDYQTDEFSVDISMLIKNKGVCTHDGFQSFFFEGANGIVVYDAAGHFKTFKFICFRK